MRSSKRTLAVTPNKYFTTKVTKYTKKSLEISPFRLSFVPFVVFVVRDNQCTRTGRATAVS